jgi:outer membrane lipoprotein-sorting protein
MPTRSRRAALALLLVLVSAPFPARAATADATLREKLFAAYAKVASYELAVLGSVRSNGIYLAPDRYRMTTVFGGKPVKTIFIGNDYWIYSDGQWQKSDTPSNNLYVDISGLLRNAKATKAPIVRRPDVVRDGKKLGQFAYTFKNGTDETCDYDPQTYLVQRCKAEDLTILYSGYNTVKATITRPH